MKNVEYICDFCKEKIAETFGQSYQGNTILIKKGILGKPVTLDLCDHCYQKLKEYCVLRPQ